MGERLTRDHVGGLITCDHVGRLITHVLVLASYLGLFVFLPGYEASVSSCTTAKATTVFILHRHCVCVKKDFALNVSQASWQFLNI